MEAATQASQIFACVRDPSRPCASGDVQPQRLLANEPERACANRAEQSLASGTRGAGHESRLDRSSRWGNGPSLIGTALYEAVVRLVWDPGANPEDPIGLSYFAS